MSLHSLGKGYLEGACKKSQPVVAQAVPLPAGFPGMHLLPKLDPWKRNIFLEKGSLGKGMGPWKRTYRPFKKRDASLEKDSYGHGKAVAITIL